MDTNLKGKTVLITGAAKGIGRETAIAFGREGSRLALLDIDAESLAETVEAVASAGGQATAFKADLSSAGDIEDKVGAATAVEWPVGIGAKGNEGVANNVTQTAGSIGYVEYAYAVQNKMTYTDMVNKDGKHVAPTSEAFAAAAANADWKGTPGYGVILANQPGAQTWPMTAATFILLYKKPDDAAATGEALKFFHWAYAKGDQMASDLSYIPMPENVVKDIEARWTSEIVGPDGKAIFAGS